MILQKILLFSHNGFSDENANGITMKNLLSAWSAEEKAEFYCGVEPPDFSAAYQYFRVTDVQAIKSFFGKQSQHMFTYEEEQPSGHQKGGNSGAGPAARIPAWLKKYKYNFVLKWIREYFWLLGPWGHSQFWKWLEWISPDVLVYMVGESIFMDHLVLRVCKKTEKPLVLYNGEGYRIIDLDTRHGLERMYYRKCKLLYRKLSRTASLSIYNCDTLKNHYDAAYPTTAKSIVAYNSAECFTKPYKIGKACVISYFGNLGVGRSRVLLQVADVLRKIDPSLCLDIYGNATEEWETAFRAHSNICYHGFISAQRLRVVIEKSDILVHVETFEEAYIPKLRYAFSTKIAQCLCAGRCFVSFAPEEMASSQYLKTVEGAVVVSTEEALITALQRLIADPIYRAECARKIHQSGQRNHQIHITSQKLREEIGAIVNETIPTGSD